MYYLNGRIGMQEGSKDQLITFIKKCLISII